MKTSKKHKQMEDRIILLPRAEEENEMTDLSWMIRDDKMLEKSVKKLPKRKKK